MGKLSFRLMRSRWNFCCRRLKSIDSIRRGRYESRPLRQLGKWPITMRSNVSLNTASLGLAACGVQSVSSNYKGPTPMTPLTHFLFGASLFMTPLLALGENSYSVPFASARVQDHGKSAISSCTRAVRERLPHPSTAEFPSIKASYTQSNPSSVLVSGRATIQKGVGQFDEVDFQCAIEKNKIVDLKITTPQTKDSAPGHSSSVVSEQYALKIMLDAYPGSLKNVQTFGPFESTLQSDVPSFAKIGEKVWYLGISCSKKGPHAKFFVHPHTAKLYFIRGPGEKLPLSCD